MLWAIEDADEVVGDEGQLMEYIFRKYYDR